MNLFDFMPDVVLMLTTSPFPHTLSDIQWMAALTAIFISLLLLSIFSRPRTLSRRWRVKAAKKTLRRVRGFNSPAQQIAYLRQIDPFIFEELVLWVLKDQGHRIKRNKRYTGDGGIDGQVWIKGKRHLVQAKRYSGYIKKAHLHEFDALCQKRRCKGLFIHTGVLGGGRERNETKHVRIMDSYALLDIL